MTPLKKAPIQQPDFVFYEQMAYVKTSAPLAGLKAHIPMV